jgi:hypothetical protein
MNAASFWDFSKYANEPILSALDSEGPMRINDLTRKCVVFLGGQRPDGEFFPYGTGFLVVSPIEGHIGFTFLVTARHVAEEIRRSRLKPSIRLNNKRGKAIIGALADEWYGHPQIPDLDLVVTPTRISSDEFDVCQVELTRETATPDYVAEHDIGCGDEVFIAGLLTSHFGANANIPVVRVGNIATMPEEPVNLGQYGRHLAYLIESRSIGGLSGSPVFFPSEFSRHTIPPLPRMATLLGVNIGLFDTLAHADRVPTGPMDRREAFLETMSSGIAVVLPAERVREIIETNPEIVEMSKRAQAEYWRKKTGFRATSASHPRTKVAQAEPADANPAHKEDFMALLSEAAQSHKQGD